MITITKPDGTKVEIPDHSHAIIHPDGRIEVSPPPAVEPWPPWPYPVMPPATPTQPDDPPYRLVWTPTTEVTGSDLRIGEPEKAGSR